MKAKHVLTSAVILLSACLAATRADGEAPPPLLDAKVKAIVDATHAFVVEHADDLKTVQNGLEHDPRFRDDAHELYIFMHACDIEKQEAICVGQGIKPELVGKNMWSLRTPTGRLLFHEFAEQTSKHEAYWLEYEWLNPYKKTIQTKRSYLRRVTLPNVPIAWIGCGYWKGDTIAGTNADKTTGDQHGERAGNKTGLTNRQPRPQDAPRIDLPPSRLDEKAKAIVEAAHVFATEHAHDMDAVQRALETDPRFRDEQDQLYVFMHACNVEKREAICVGQGIKPELLGKNMWSLSTPTGRMPFHELAMQVQAHDEFWLEYEWLNPYTRSIQTKRSFVKKISLPTTPLAWVGCGYWKPAKDTGAREQQLVIATDTPPTPLDQKTKAIVEAAHAFARDHAQDMKAVQAALASDPRFRDDEDHLYVFMHAYNAQRKEAICLGHGLRPGLIGKNMWSLRSPAGLLLLQAFVDLMEEHEELWVEYEWLNPYNGRVQTKRSFIKKISLPSAPTAWVACGFWKP